jgi:hypothetical protein
MYISVNVDTLREFPQRYPHDTAVASTWTETCTLRWICVVPTVIEHVTVNIFFAICATFCPFLVQIHRSYRPKLVTSSNGEGRAGSTVHLRPSLVLSGTNPERFCSSYVYCELDTLRSVLERLACTVSFACNSQGLC